MGRPGEATFGAPWRGNLRDALARQLVRRPGEALLGRPGEAYVGSPWRGKTRRPDLRTGATASRNYTHPYNRRIHGGLGPPWKGMLETPAYEDTLRLVTATRISNKL